MYDDVGKFICKANGIVDISFNIILLIAVLIVMALTALLYVVPAGKCRTCLKDLKALELRIMYLETKLEERNIQDRARTESLLVRIISLEGARFLESKEFHKLNEERQRQLAAEIISFDAFSGIKSLRHHHRCLIWDKYSNTLTYSGPDIANSFASSSIALPSDRPVQWRVKILNLPHNWLWMGIVGELDGSIHDAASYWHDTAYGWACGNHVWIGGAFNSRHGGWSGWSEGDCAVFMYDPDRRTLSLRLERTLSGSGSSSNDSGDDASNRSSNALLSYTIENIQCEKAFIHCHFYYPGTCVKFSGADPMT